MASNKKNFSYNVALNLDIDAFKQQAKELQTFEFISPESQERFIDQVAQAKKLNEEVRILQQSLEEIEHLHGPEWDDMRKALQEQIDELTKEDRAAEKKEDAKKALKDFFKDLGKKAQQMLLGFFKDIFDKAIQMLDDIAAYSNQSLKYSQEATDLRLSYGLSGAQAYAYQKAAEDAGFGSFEGYLENAAFASRETLQRFDELVNLYQVSYEQDEELAKSYQRFQVEFEDFKKEMATSLIEFFMDNKDTIMTLMQFAVDALEVIMQAVSWLVEHLGGGRDRTAYERSSALSDIYNSYGGAKTTNIKIDNSFQGVSPNDRQTYSNAGEMTYRQIIAALR